MHAENKDEKLKQMSMWKLSNAFVDKEEYEIQHIGLGMFQKLPPGKVVAENQDLGSG